MKKAIAFLLSLATICSACVSCGNSVHTDDQSDTNFTDIHSTTTEATVSSVYETNTNTTSTMIENEITTTSATTASTDISNDPAETEVVDEDDSLTVKRNSVAWLNYAAMLTQEINATKNSKMKMEEVYSRILNNTAPSSVDQDTQGLLNSLLDIIQKYGMIDVKRDRIKYLYEQNQAQKVRSAIPNPLGLLSAVSSLNPARLLSSVAFMTIDSFTSYDTYKSEVDKEYLMQGWELDDEAAENLHLNRKRVFEYMIEIVREYHLSDDLALNEASIKQFVECKEEYSLDQQIRFLESSQNTYKAFGNYWLLLAECYFNKKQYRACLNCIDKYQELDYTIFRKDYDLAKAMPIAIAAAKEAYSIPVYRSQAEKFLKIILNNTDINEEWWALRFYAAEVYSDLFANTNSTEYLKTAYNILLDNTTQLVNKQKKMNKDYLSDFKELSIPNNATDDEKDKLEDYNDKLEEKRKTELPTTYEPLALNCELLFSIAEKLNVSASDKNQIEGILTDGGKSVFLTESLINQFSFNKTKTTVNAEYDKDELTIPVSLVAEGATLKVTVTNGDEVNVYDDWTIDDLERDGNDISSYKVTYESDNIDDCKWSADSRIKVEIINGDWNSSNPYILEFKVADYRGAAFDWGWIPDWVPLVSEDISFEQVT